MRAVEASEVNEHEIAAVGAAAASVAFGTDHDPAGASLGQRLRTARERRGWERAEVGARLKLPVKLIARLEEDDYEGLTQGVFLRGYLASYARLVGVPVDDATTVAQAHSHAAPLVATGTIPRSRYLFDRYSVSATYLVLTAIIVVPAVWLATHGGLEQNLARTTPLDPPAALALPAEETQPPAEASSQALAASSAMPPESVTMTPPPVAVPDEPAAPVIASMAPFTAARAPAPAAAPSADAPATVGSGAHSLVLKLEQQSWVEILGADGRRLEYGMLAGGSERTYRSDGPLSLRLGNAQGARVISDGAVVDLAAFQRGNVAHVKLFGGNGPSRPEQ